MEKSSRFDDSSWESLVWIDAVEKVDERRSACNIFLLPDSSLNPYSPVFIGSAAMRECGDAYTKMNANLFGCATARNKGTCSNDSVGQWIDAACKRGAGLGTTMKDLYESYRTRCDNSGVDPLSNAYLGKELTHRGSEQEGRTPSR